MTVTDYTTQVTTIDFTFGIHHTEPTVQAIFNYVLQGELPEINDFFDGPTKIIHNPIDLIREKLQYQFETDAHQTEDLNNLEQIIKSLTFRSIINDKESGRLRTSKNFEDTLKKAINCQQKVLPLKLTLATSSLTPRPPSLATIWTMFLSHPSNPPPIQLHKAMHQSNIWDFISMSTLQNLMPHHI